MTKFNGNNNSKTLKTAFERANYKLNAYSPNDVQVVDFHFAEKTFYGRVNRQLDPVLINETFLRTFHNQDFRILHFVRDQYREMSIRYQNALDLSLISNEDANLSKIEILRAYESPLESYKIETELFMNSFLSNQIIPNEKKVESFNSFLTLFENYIIDHDLNRKFTLSGFMKSGESSIFNSGLALQIANTPFSNDAQKEQQILTSTNFSFYKNVVNQFGFSINMQNPSVLIADLAHPTTSKFRERYNLLTVNSVFDKHYIKTYTHDFDMMKNYLIDTYNSFVYLKPNLKKVYICKDKTKSTLTLRNNIDNLNEHALLLLYIKIRNMEEFFPFSLQDLKSIHRTASRLFVHNKNSALSYIESQFRTKYNTKNGSLTYYSKKINQTT